MPTSVQISFETELLRRVEELSRGGHRQEILTALADVFQHELTVHPSNRQGQIIKYASGLENIMRGVAASLNKEHLTRAAEPGTYIGNKIRGGVAALASELKQDLPDFGRNEAAYKFQLTAAHDYK